MRARRADRGHALLCSILLVLVAAFCLAAVTAGLQRESRFLRHWRQAQAREDLLVSGRHLGRLAAQDPAWSGTLEARVGAGLVRVRRGEDGRLVLEVRTPSGGRLTRTVIVPEASPREEAPSSTRSWERGGGRPPSPPRPGAPR